MIEFVPKAAWQVLSVDKQFLEFWGNLLIAAAKGQQQLDDVSKWMSQGMEGGRAFTALFQQFYGIGCESELTNDSWKAARNAFEKAYAAYLDTLGVVAKSEYMALARRCEELRDNAERKEAELRKLRLELSASRAAQGDAIRGFQELVEVQSEQFQEITERFNRLVTGSWPDKAELKKA